MSAQIHQNGSHQPAEGSGALTFCILQDPLQKNWVLSYSLGYQQDAFWDLSAPHQGICTLLLERHLTFSTSYFISPTLPYNVWMSVHAPLKEFRYLNEVLKSLVVLLELFKKADCFIVTAAEFSINLFHFLLILLWQLQKIHKHTHTHVLLRLADGGHILLQQEPLVTCWSRTSPIRWMR